MSLTHLILIKDPVNSTFFLWKITIFYETSCVIKQEKHLLINSSLPNKTKPKQTTYKDSSVNFKNTV